MERTETQLRRMGEFVSPEGCRIVARVQFRHLRKTTMSFGSRIALGLTSLLVLPGLASAHPETSMLATGWAGFLHPLTGLDHFLAMFAAGLWAAHLGGQAKLMLPVTFVGAMAVGVFVAAGGWMLPAVEPVIAISVIVFGAMVAVGVKAPLGVAVAVVALFAIFHGHAHATEGPQNAVPYGVGFLSATMALHAIGILAGTYLANQARVLTCGGSAIATTGLALLLA
jgi:urease accessory protein